MKHLGLTQKAYELIKERLLNGQITPGERIMEDLIAEELSISRTPVRESINRLAAEGFVIQMPRKGVCATQFTQDELIDIVEMRVIIESYAARKCCKNITESQLKELQNIFNKLSSALQKKDSAVYGVYDGLFHRKLGEYSGNKLIEKSVNEIEDLAVFARRMDVYGNSNDWSEEIAIEQHKDIVTAIKNRDEEAAAIAVERNTKEMLRRIRS